MRSDESMRAEDLARQGVSRKGMCQADLGGKQMLSEGCPSSPEHLAESMGHLTLTMEESIFSDAVAGPLRPHSRKERMIRGH